MSLSLDDVIAVLEEKHGFSFADDVVADAVAKKDKKESADESKDADLKKMTKAEIVEHASDVHGIDLDASKPKPELIAAVEEARSAPKE